jgi:hypothetical protein
MSRIMMVILTVCVLQSVFMKQLPLPHKNLSCMLYNLNYVSSLVPATLVLTVPHLDWNVGLEVACVCHGFYDDHVNSSCKHSGLYLIRDFPGSYLGRNTDKFECCIS